MIPPTLRGIAGLHCDGIGGAVFVRCEPHVSAIPGGFWLAGSSSIQGRD